MRSRNCDAFRQRLTPISNLFDSLLGIPTAITPALPCSKALFLPQERCPRHADEEKENEKDRSENRAETPVVHSRQVTAIRINGAGSVREWGNDSHNSQLH